MHYIDDKPDGCLLSHVGACSGDVGAVALALAVVVEGCLRSKLEYAIHTLFIRRGKGRSAGAAGTARGIIATLTTAWSLGSGGGCT